MEMQKTFNQKIMFGCPSCGLEDIVDHKKNADEAYLDFLTRFDDGKVLTKKKMQTALEQEGIVQSEDEIKKMIGAVAPVTSAFNMSKSDSLLKRTIFHNI